MTYKSVIAETKNGRAALLYDEWLDEFVIRTETEIIIVGDVSEAEALKELAEYEN